MKGFRRMTVVVSMLLMVVACHGRDAIKTVHEGKQLEMGSFVDGKLTGLGLVADENNQIDRIGTWKGGEIDGLGIRVNKVYTDIGEFTEGRMNGAGMKKSKGGDVYIGNFVADNYQGKGVMYYADGRTYTGMFKDNTPEGLGIMQSPKGSVFIGQFKNGVAEGKGMLILPNGKRIVGRFANDEPTASAKYYDR